MRVRQARHRRHRVVVDGPRVALLDDGGRERRIEEGRTDVTRDAGPRHGETAQLAVEPRCGRLVGGLRRDDGAGVADGGGLVGGDARPEQAGDGDGGDDPDDGYHDEKLDQGEAVLPPHRRFPLSLPLIRIRERSIERTRGDLLVPPCRLEQGYRSAGQVAVWSWPVALQHVAVDVLVVPTTPLESPPKARTPVVDGVIGDAS